LVKEALNKAKFDLGQAELFGQRGFVFLQSDFALQVQLVLHLYEVCMGFFVSAKAWFLFGGIGESSQAGDMQAGDAVADFVHTGASTVAFKYGKHLAFGHGFTLADAQLSDDTAVSRLDDLGFVLWNELTLGSNDLVDVKPNSPKDKQDEDEKDVETHASLG
jgi:hypothetical protein